MDPKDLQQVNEAVQALRDTVEKGVLTAEDREVISKANAALDTYEAANATLTQEVESAKAEAKIHNEKIVALEELAKETNPEAVKKIQDQIVALETVVCRSNNGAVADAVAKVLETHPECKALEAMVRDEEKALLEHKDYLRTDSNSQGGYLVTAVTSNEILRQIEEISPVRQFARKYNVKTKSLEIPVRKSIPTATFEGEREEGGNSNSQYRLETLVAYAQQITTPVTRDLINFSNKNILSEMAQDASLSFAKGEGNSFLVGTGEKMPHGILTDSRVGITTSASSGVIILDEVIELAGKLKQGYNGMYSFNKTTLYQLRTEKDSNGNYLWTMGAERMPSQINGFNYAIMQDMPDVAASSLSVMFADLFMGYSILDSVAMELVRDDFTRKKERVIEFTWFRWLTGQVAIPEAIQLLKTKA